MNATSSALAHSPPPRANSIYLTVLTRAFAVFSSLRVVAYLPTLWAVMHSGDSSQHSSWTWFLFAGANATMAAWIFEKKAAAAPWS